MDDSLKLLGRRGSASHGVKHWELENSQITFIHSRLSIIDLSDGANRPFFFKDSRGIVFASEPNVIRKTIPSTNTVNKCQASTYMMFVISDYGSETFFEGIHQLEPGKMLNIDLSRQVCFDTPQSVWIKKVHGFIESEINDLGDLINVQNILNDFKNPVKGQDHGLFRVLSFVLALGSSNFTVSACKNGN